MILLSTPLFSHWSIPLKYKCEKNCTFSNILQKVKSHFLPISIILRVIPIKFETLKPPSVGSYQGWGREGLNVISLVVASRTLLNQSILYFLYISI